MSKTILGIDFGTSRTVVAKTTTEARFEPEIVEVDNKPFVETILRLDQSGTIELYGTEAWEKIDEAPDRTFYEFKMGISKIGTSEQNQPATTEVAEASFTPQRLGEMFLKRILEKIERQGFNCASLADRVIMTVIGYPAKWNEIQRTATIAMAKRAGFPNVKGCEEPLGVIYYHHYKGDLSADKEQIMLVYDFGGGTSDVAVVKTLADEKPKVLGIGGALNLGGRDFDTAVYNILLDQHQLDPQSMDPRDIVSMRREARNLKEELAASRDDGRDRVDKLLILYGNGSKKSLLLDVQTFEQSCSAMIDRFPEPADEALKQAGLSPEDINVSILAGGSARMHYVRKALDELFPNDIVLQSTNPAEVVAKGLAIYGRILHEGGKLVVTSQATASSQPNPGTGPASATTPSSPHHPQTGANQVLSMASNFWGKLSNRGKMLLSASGVLVMLLLLSLMFSGGDNDEFANMPLDDLRRHAESGHPAAQNSLGLLYFYGDEVHKSDAQAFYWFRKSAEQGNANAQYNLGFMYENGYGTRKDILESYKWYYISSRLGDQDATDRLKEMLKNKILFFGADISDAEAKKVERDADNFIRSKGW